MNDAVRLAPEADVLYAADARWWLARDGSPGFAGRRWTQATQPLRGDMARRFAECVTRHGINVVASGRKDEPSFDPKVISQGLNSGFQAVNLAVLMGATRVILLGFDMSLSPEGRSHFFGDHVGEMNVRSPYSLFAKAFEKAAPLYRAKGVEIVNASRRTALRCFPRASLEEALGDDPS